MEPFVVNVPDNISRVDIDQYLKTVQDQRRKGLHYSYTTDDESDEEETVEEEEKKTESQSPIRKIKEPWNEVSLILFELNRYSEFFLLVETLAFIIRRRK